MQENHSQEEKPMSDKKTFRSEEARKNYEKAERQRAQAQKRKAAEAKKNEMTGKATAWLKQNPRKAVIAAAAVLAVIVLVWMGCKAAFGPLAGKEDNWLIMDVSASSKAHDYQHLADFDMPEGYTRGDYSLYDDGVQQDFFCEAEDAANPVQDVYVSGAKGISAAEYPAVVLSYNIHKEAGEPRQLTIGGKECSALYLVSDESQWSGDDMAIAHMSFYFDTDKGACVTATFRSGTMPFDQLPDEAAMLAEAERVLAGLILVK